ncbi:GNAT family protein [Pusillimonas sp. SM2304]|uniref:GNAT family N-acetyltransferase n=1 Tax=Pusillimonas sp. SM2304 TaxID=3073241 RepID=UPI002874016F|nr:GNAT family protein [Pusillimonas sp. SM2304]MDS1142389.1 GNAT family protein [Pusillimonas sp. SM2304]
MMIFDADVIGPWVASRIEGMTYYPGTSTGIARVKDGKIVAGVLYQDHNGPNVFAHIAVDPGGMNRRFLSIIFDYPFNQLKAKRITGVVASSNAAAKKLDEHLGFELEAILHDAHPDGDLCIYKMTADQCRWIKELPYESHA